jgi:hypothetical protein
MSAENCKSSSKSKKEFWKHHIESCSQSGLSQNRYCKENGLALSTFSYWKRQLAKRSQATKPKFYPLTLQAPPSTSPAGKDSGLSLYLGNDKYRIELSEDFSPGCLKKLISVLQRQ